MSRSNDITITVRPSPEARTSDGVDQVRNGNRWRVAGLDPTSNRIAAERLSDSARVVFDTDYLRTHVTLGYAATVHSAQGVTADSCYAILGQGASRAMLYVAMTRGRHNNQAVLYQRITNEADHDHTKPVAGDGIHVARRGNKYTAAHHLRMILANDDRPRTMHAEAERTERHLLLGVVREVLERHEQRRRVRQVACESHLEAAEAWRTGRELIAAAIGNRSHSVELSERGLDL